MYKTFKYLFAFVSALLILSSSASAGAYKGPDLSGQKVVISGPWLAPQDEQFRKVIKAFTDSTGATVEYGGSDSFEQQIIICICSSNSIYK